MFTVVSRRSIQILLLLSPLLWSCAADVPQKEAAEESPQSVKVALCQIFCLDGDRSGNLARIDHALAEAKTVGAQIACFPETALLGWVNPAAHERAHPIPGEDSESLAALARKHRVWICCGLAEKAGEKLHDSALLIDSSGNIVLKHRKMNILTQLMDPPYTPGTEVAAADTPLGRIGLLICADSFKTEHLERMASLKPDLVLIPYGWAAPEDRWPGHGLALERTVCAAARAIGAPVVGTDVVGAITSGPWRGFVYGGQSLAADRTGTVLARCGDRIHDVVVVEIPLA